MNDVGALRAPGTVRGGETGLKVFKISRSSKFEAQIAAHHGKGNRANPAALTCRETNPFWVQQSRVTGALSEIHDDGEQHVVLFLPLLHPWLLLASIDSR